MSQIDKLRNKKAHQRTEEDWDAIYDAQQLARAEVIRSDEKRMAAAKLWAQVLVEEESDEFNAMNKIANG